MAKRKQKVAIQASSGSMLIEERRQHELEQIQRNGRVLVSELSDALGISRITIRKDLDNLEQRGLVQRTHGGALAARASSLVDLTLKEKEQQQSHEKTRIAHAAAKLVREGQCVLLDSGTTTTAVGRALLGMTHLTVVTNAINIAAEMTNTAFDVILTGGTLRKNSFSLVGPLAEEMLGEIHADILFLGVDGFDPQYGITTPNFLESRVNRAMVKAARKVVAVCDSTKFRRRSLALIVPPTAVHMVITDTQLEDEDAETLRSMGIELMLV